MSNIPTTPNWLKRDMSHKLDNLKQQMIIVSRCSDWKVFAYEDEGCVILEYVGKHAHLLCDYPNVKWPSQEAFMDSQMSAQDINTWFSSNIKPIVVNQAEDIGVFHSHVPVPLHQVPLSLRLEQRKMGIEYDAYTCRVENVSKAFEDITFEEHLPIPFIGDYKAKRQAWCYEAIKRYAEDYGVTVSKVEKTPHGVEMIIGNDKYLVQGDSVLDPARWYELLPIQAKLDDFARYIKGHIPGVTLVTLDKDQVQVFFDKDVVSLPAKDCMQGNPQVWKTLLAHPTMVPSYVTHASYTADTSPISYYDYFYGEASNKVDTKVMGNTEALKYFITDIKDEAVVITLKNILGYVVYGDGKNASFIERQWNRLPWVKKSGIRSRWKRLVQNPAVLSLVGLFVARVALARTDQHHKVFAAIGDTLEHLLKIQLQEQVDNVFDVDKIIESITFLLGEASREKKLPLTNLEDSSGPRGVPIVRD